MRLICCWCAILAAVAAQNQEFYAPQTFRNQGSSSGFFQPGRWDRGIERAPLRNPTSHTPDYKERGLFTPSSGNDVTPQGSIPSWRPAPAPVHEQWPAPVHHSAPAPLPPRVEPWRSPLTPTKEQQAVIIHHKQALTKEGNFRFEYEADNGLAAGEVIEPDGTRVGAYQYKDPSGQLVKLKYRAGKDGFQILEGSHLPKSPEPVAPPTHDQHYVHAYEQQRQQYQLQQQYNQERPKAQTWGGNNQGYSDGRAVEGQQYNWRPNENEDDGQYRENEVDNLSNRGPHTFGEGYAFAFQG